MKMDYKNLRNELSQVEDDGGFITICSKCLSNYIENSIIKQEYDNWRTNSSNEEFALYEKLIEYESYFDDMCFSKNSIMGKYTLNNEKADDLTDYLCIDSNDFSVHIQDISSEACVQSYNHSMIFHPNSIDKKDVLLHEMIHIHELILLSQTPSIFKDILIIELYKKLSPLHPDLDKWITQHCNLNSNLDLQNFGGEHDLLFFLKSIELDDRCGYDTFTIMGYDYTQKMQP